MNVPGEPVLDKPERGDLDDPRKIGRKALLDKLQARQEQEDIAFVLSSEQGRRFYWHVLELCGIFKEPFTGNNTTFYNLGQVSIGRTLWRHLTETHTDSYFQMLKERQYEQAKKG